MFAYLNVRNLSLVTSSTQLQGTNIFGSHKTSHVLLPMSYNVWLSSQIGDSLSLCSEVSYEHLPQKQRVVNSRQRDKGYTIDFSF